MNTSLSVLRVRPDHVCRKRSGDFTLAGIEGLIWNDLRATFRTRLAEAGCDAFQSPNFWALRRSCDQALREDN
jgi:hypothetical protein